MTLSEINERLVGTGYPVAYSHFSSPQIAPYICYMQTASDNFAADNTMYFPAKEIRIELYTEKKDLEAEAKIEAALSGLFWESHESYIEAEKMLQIIYEIEV